MHWDERQDWKNCARDEQMVPKPAPIDATCIDRPELASNPSRTPKNGRPTDRLLIKIGLEFRSPSSAP